MLEEEEEGEGDGSYGTTRSVSPLNSSTALASPLAEELLLLGSTARLPLLDDPTALVGFPANKGFLVGGSAPLLLSCCGGLFRELD